MSQRAYAKRRGVSAMAVSRAVRSGRLKASVRDGKIIDPDLADREWAANTDLTDAPSSVIEQSASWPGVDRPVAPPPPAGEESAGEGTPLHEANRIEKVWKAKTAELKYKQEAGELVPAAEVRGKLEDTFRTCRTKLLGIPSRARQVLPHLTVGDIAAIESMVREALEDLAGAAA